MAVQKQSRLVKNVKNLQPRSTIHIHVYHPTLITRVQLKTNTDDRLSLGNVLQPLLSPLLKNEAPRKAVIIVNYVLK